MTYTLAEKVDWIPVNGETDTLLELTELGKKLSQSIVQMCSVPRHLFAESRKISRAKELVAIAHLYRVMKTPTQRLPTRNI